MQKKKSKITKTDVKAVLFKFYIKLDLLEKEIDAKIVVPTTYPGCTWCKSRDAVCALKFRAFDKDWERPVCGLCKISLGSSILKDNVQNL